MIIILYYSIIPIFFMCWLHSNRKL